MEPKLTEMSPKNTTTTVLFEKALPAAITIDAKKTSFSSEPVLVAELANSDFQNSTTSDDALSSSKLTSKLDYALLPLCYVLNLVSSLDKVSIGNARIQGLEKSLNMNPLSNQFNIALSLFWIPYILFGVVSNVILKNVRPAWYLGGCAVAFGIVCMCQGFVHNFTGLVVCRLFLGLAESAISPGTVYLISMYYSRWELQRRYAVLWTNGFVAGAFGGLFAFALAKMDGIAGLEGWRWIFIIEGLMTILVGIVAVFFLFDWPSITKRLSKSEKALLQNKLKHDGENQRMDRLDRKAVKRIVSDWKIYMGAMLFCCISVSSASLGFFMPFILKEFGYTSSQSQLHTIPVWAVSCVVTLGVGWLSDRSRRRAIFVFIGCGVTTIGYIMLLCQGPIHGGLPLGVKYLALFITAAGVFTIQPVIVIWLLTNLSGHYKRGIGAAFQSAWGNIGSIVASNIFLTKQAPTFFTGYGVALGFVGMEAILAVVFMLALKRENRKRARGERDGLFVLPKEEAENLGDDHPDFRFNF